MTSERDIMAKILAALPGYGITGWRNNTGMGWTGSPLWLPDGSLVLSSPRPLHAGLCRGSSDIIGLRPIHITDEWLGKVIAQFVAIEVKGDKGRLSSEQVHFLEFVHSHGGMAVVARDVADLGAYSKKNVEGVPPRRR